MASWQLWWVGRSAGVWAEYRESGHPSPDGWAVSLAQTQLGKAPLDLDVRSGDAVATIVGVDAEPRVLQTRRARVGLGRSLLWGPPSGTPDLADVRVLGD